MRIGNDTKSDAPRLTTSRRLAGWLAACCLILQAGCRKDMYDQPKYEANDPTTFFSDGTSQRPAVAGTVARDELHLDSVYYLGKTAEGKDTEVFPMAVDRDLIELGRERYQVYCTPCHGGLGDGRGMVVRRGFSPPPSFHAEYLRKIPVGHFFDVITNGYGAMYSYGSRVPVKHRWAIAAYIRTLQYSQDASPEDLTPAQQKALAEADRSTNPDESRRLAEVTK
ncbi:c-type cytochrome [Tundrisphaera lichenicola]|uniref:c-type cytochrome n=1 Tax=Tundrisphaera lichenicola TaxID=2029860 RepID=UPI003EB7C70E